MKKLLLLVACCCLGSFANAQWCMNNQITFDPGDTFNHLVTIDTVHYHHNIWQIGRPHKTYFTPATSSGNVMVTDTANPYPARDTSAFILKMPYAVNASACWGWAVAPAVYMHFSYQLRKDTNSIAMLEASTDNGAHWYNLKDTVPHGLSLPGGTPSLADTTTTGAYYTVSMNMPYTDSFPSDTFLFRFTFISDSVTPGRDGWEIDDIVLEYYSEGLAQVQNNNLIALYPNPSDGHIFLHTTNPQPASVNVYDMLGREVYTTSKLPANDHLYLPLPPGIYTLKYTTDKEYAVKRVEITR